MVKDLKQEKEEQYQIHIQSTQELIHAHNQAIAQIQEKQKLQSKKTQIKNQETIREKEEIISELNKEVENWSQNYATYAQNTRQKIEETFEKEKNNLILEKEEAFSKMEQHYESLITGIKEKQEQELKNLKEKYDTEFYEKSSKLDDRMVELKEEHDNQLHNLRIEMENELLAEKRKSAGLNEQNINDIQKLQKEFRQLQSELELKNLKITNLQLESTNNTEELQKLRVDSKELRQHNNKLQILWENQGPEMEEQKQQIASLQRLNRQLSQYIHENQSVTYKHIDDNREKSQKKNNVSELLKNIHIHDKDL